MATAYFWMKFHVQKLHRAHAGFAGLQDVRAAKTRPKINFLTKHAIKAGLSGYLLLWVFCVRISPVSYLEPPWDMLVLAFILLIFSARIKDGHHMAMSKNATWQAFKNF